VSCSFVRQSESEEGERGGGGDTRRIGPEEKFMQNLEKNREAVMGPK
jgi:hypothetical protein